MPCITASTVTAVPAASPIQTMARPSGGASGAPAAGVPLRGGLLGGVAVAMAGYRPRVRAAAAPRPLRCSALPLRRRAPGAGPAARPQHRGEHEHDEGHDQGDAGEPVSQDGRDRLVTAGLSRRRHQGGMPVLVLESRPRRRR